MYECPNPECCGKKERKVPCFQRIDCDETEVTLTAAGTVTNEEVTGIDEGTVHCYYCGTKAKGEPDEED